VSEKTWSSLGYGLWLIWLCFLPCRYRVLLCTCFISLYYWYHLTCSGLWSKSNRDWWNVFKRHEQFFFRATHPLHGGVTDIFTLQIIQLIEGKASAYVFASPGCKKWDTCAPEVILHAVGGQSVWSRRRWLLFVLRHCFRTGFCHFMCMGVFSACMCTTCLPGALG
jgi:hypothetical protein